MLPSATTEQNETISRLISVLSGHPIRFTIVGSAACREYGLSRPANDLDFIVGGYVNAMSLLARVGEYRPALDSPDPTGRTCTQTDVRTGVNIDFLTEGIRISDRVWLNGILSSDPLPIPLATGIADVAPLLTLITMKVNVIASGLETIRLGANMGGRKIEDVRKDTADVKELIRCNQLARDLPLGNELLQRQYEEIFDGRLVV